MHSVSGCRTPTEDDSLRTIPDIIERFGQVTGLPDRALDNTTTIISVACGVSFGEKHFTLYRTSGGPGDSFSLVLKAMAALCRDSKTAWWALANCLYHS